MFTEVIQKNHWPEVIDGPVSFFKALASLEVIAGPVTYIKSLASLEVMSGPVSHFARENNALILALSYDSVSTD